MPFEFHPTLNMTPIEMIFRHVLFYVDHGELNRTVWVERGASHHQERGALILRFLVELNWEMRIAEISAWINQRNIKRKMQFFFCQ